ncbi:MAG: twin-arginine translocase subunit TatC [Candidatus Hydrothermarchaeales archaeon]
MLEDSRIDIIGILDVVKKKFTHLLIIMGVGFALGWFVAEFVIQQIKRDMLEGLEGAELIATSPIEYVLVQIEIALVFAVFLAAPFVLYWILSRYKRKLRGKTKSLLAWAAASFVLFLIGFSFTYFLILPKAIWILTYLTTAADIYPYYSVSSFMTFALLSIVVFTAVFELPLFVTWLAINGFVSVERLKEKRKAVIVVIFILTGIITPDPTPFSQLLLSVPLILLYEASIVSAKIFSK